MDEKLDQLLRFDPLDAAEKLIGESYKDDKATVGLGLMLMQAAGAEKEAALLARNDTLLSNDLDRYLSIIETNGFEKVLEDDFMSPLYPDVPEKFFIYAHQDGMLLAFDTFSTHRMNSGHLYYNWCPTEQEKLHGSGATESGSFVAGNRETGEVYIWAGNHDCREALIYHIETLREHGSFVKPWVEAPFLWLLHHGETRGGHGNYDHKAITMERISRLPEWVQTMIGPYDG